MRSSLGAGTPVVSGLDWSYAPAGGSPGGLDGTTPNVARMCNFRADRELAERVMRQAPITARLCHVNRGFLHRVARFLAQEVGIEQFLDIGCGLPAEINLDDTVRRIRPTGRVAYVDNDPMVISHARALMAVNGSIGVYGADLRDPGDVLGHPGLGQLIDLDRPVALFLLNVLHFIPYDPHGILGEFVRRLPSGSYVVVSHAERTPELEGVSVLYEEANLPFTPRSRREIARLLYGLEPVPGYPARLPRPRQGREPEAGDAVALIGCVGRKP
jgi:hypothetical protein